MKTMLKVVVTALLPVQISDLAASGNGVVLVDPSEAGGEPLAISPEEPLPYEPFTAYILAFADTTGPGASSNHSIAVDIDISQNLLAVIHREGGEIVPPPMAPPSIMLRIEMQGLPPGDYVMESFSLDTDGLGSPTTDLYFSVAESPPTQQATTLFHPGIDHYFVTADDDELDSLIGDPVQGWFKTDLGFNVWPADSPAPSTALPVCRFYSSLVNSHFYTASESECMELQESPDSGWAYEGTAFQALVPTAGACPAGTTPVWRLFNNRQHELDSNHRFVASPETYRIMITDGWAGEGVAFCSPPESL